jgi:hypothetical protein
LRAAWRRTQVLEIIYAAYRAARHGKVELPLQLTDEEAARPPFAQLET